MHYHNIILFFEPALVLVDLAFERFDREIDRFLETFAPALGHQVVPRNMEVDRGDFISEFVVFIQFQYDVGSDSPFDKTVEFVHFVLYEFDQLPVGVEFYGLNLYVHNTMFYKVRYLRSCAPADQFCCFVCSAPFFSRG